MSNDWSDEELEASVAAYRQMQRREAEFKPYNKRKVYRELAERFGRTEKAFEYRMQNISAVLNDLGEPWLSGLKPAANVGANVRFRIEALVKQTTKTGPAAQKMAPYKAKLPTMRVWLVELARQQCVVTYSETMGAFGLDRFSLRHAMDYLGHQAENNDEPIITALIVSATTHRCSPGLAKAFKIHDDEAERKKLFEYWAQAEPTDEAEDDESTSLAVQAARFASVEVRPAQAAFRRLVFEASKGRCVISGCSIRCALDAAHKVGRKWRDGYNRAEDGFLLRKDLHSLYDAKLLRIDEAGRVEFEASIAEHYPELQGAKILR